MARPTFFPRYPAVAGTAERLLAACTVAGGLALAGPGVAQEQGDAGRTPVPPAAPASAPAPAEAAPVVPGASAAAPAAAADELPIQLEADHLSGSPDREAIAEGGVDLRQGDLRLQADRLRYDVAADRVKASGHVQADRGGDRFTGTELELQLQSYQGYVLEPTYFFSRSGAGGSARRLDIESRQRSRLAGANYTSCAPDGSGTPAWILETDRIRLDFDRNEGLAQGAVLRFYGVPILAAPSLTFPLTDERKSGWLPPSLAIDSKSGVELQAPYYWNIAPNRDLTLTPVVSTRRGAGVDAEFRYLAPNDHGQTNIHLLPDDRTVGRSRHSIDLRHVGGMPGTFDYSARVLRVSDDEYWKDFSSYIDNITPRLLPTDLRAGRRWALGSEGSVSTYARVQRWQVLQDPDPLARIVSPYQRSPQLGVGGYGRGGLLRWAAQTEYNRFTLPSEDIARDRPTGNRLHFAGNLSLPYETPGWTLTPKLSLNAATYDLDRPLADGRRHVSRWIPTFSIDSTWVLERDATWFGRAMRQTLEPRLLYVRTPYRDQLGLPNFDSAARDFNFESIYDENAFSGIDRVSDSHQVTAGVTSRLIDPVTGAEAVRVGLMQRFLLRDQRITPEGEPLTKRFSDILLLGSTRWVPRWTFDAALRYNPDTDRPIRSVIGARYSPGPFRTVGLTYRYARGLSEQVDFGWQWPIYRSAAASSRPLGARRGAGSNPSCAGTWYTVGRVNYSMRDSRVTDSLFGVEYDAGCWIGRVVAERLSTGRSEATSRLMIQLELVGLSRLGINPLSVLKDNVPGYRLLRDDPDDLDGPSSSE